MNNEKILQSLIDSGHLTFSEKCIIESQQHNFRKFSELYLFEFIQQALFDECSKRGYLIEILDGFEISHNKSGKVILIAENTTRESWVAAYCKVMGIEA